MVGERSSYSVKPADQERAGLYEQQDEEQPKSNLCGKFYTDENGDYAFYCLRPTPYPIPYDGPAGKLLQLLDRHPYRPAHIHFIVRTCDPA
jgi:catechol 1,2-dioxygenase